MTITSALVLFSVIWFMTFLCVIPIRLQTQGDVGHVVPGTQAGAPEHHSLKKKAWITTGITVVLWGIISAIIFSGMVTIRDIDLYHRMAPLETNDTNG
jgi:predicted secreted protein